MSKVRGIDGVVRTLQQMAKDADPTLAVEMRRDGEQIMTDIKDTRPGRGVPRKDGILAGSGRVEGPDAAGLVSLTFGGAAAAYALRQHEDLTLRHKLGEARYLTRGIERWVAKGGPRAALWRAANNLIGKSLRARAQARGERGRFASGTRYDALRRRGTGG